MRNNLSTIALAAALVLALAFIFVLLAKCDFFSKEEYAACNECSSSSDDYSSSSADISSSSDGDISSSSSEVLPLSSSSVKISSSSAKASSSSKSVEVSSSSYDDSSSSSSSEVSLSLSSSANILPQCGGTSYNTATQFCYNNSKVGSFCGSNPQKSYNPDLYECKQNVNSNGIYLKTPISYKGKTYNAVLIGEQVWMAKNLNYNIAGSKCYGDVSGNDNQNCATYGRLYNWLTAMALNTECNNKSCIDLIKSPHQGICPSGWHIPSNADWNKLYNYVDSDYGEFSTASLKAGKYLKSSSGWNNYKGKSGNGNDAYGFSALPGGFSEGDFGDVGYDGGWWSASEYGNNNAYGWYMLYDLEYANRHNYAKSVLFSIRCVQD